VQETLIPFAQKTLETGVKHIVFLSVAGAETNRIVPHHKVEVFLKSTKSYTILRPGFFAQNLQDAYRKDILEQDRIYVPAGQGKVAFVDLRDVALVAAHALLRPAEHANQGYTLTGPQAVSFAEAAQMLSQCLGRQVKYQAASVLGYLWHLHRRRLPWMQAFVQTVLHVGLRFGQAEKVDATLRRLIDREPYGLAQYIHDHANTWKLTPAPHATEVQTGR
jgi:nucleoside-diphosphate-sugar epimerase